MKKSLLTYTSATLFSLFSLLCEIHANTFSFGTAINPNGDTLKVDQDGFILNGKHIVPVMGEIHFSRVPAKDWRREIRKMKAGGITILSTYVFWIHHESVEGVWDWSGNRNLHSFLQICKEENMPVVLRIGPFCHGEVLQGGFPTWLVNKSLSDSKSFRLRSEAPGFIAATQRLFSNIYAQSSDMLWKHGGPVIGIQIENECRGPWSYLMRLKDMATAIGFDVPFYTRTGWPKLNGKEEYGKLLPLYGDYADGFWDRKLTDMPGDYPKAFIMKDNRISSVIATETFTASELKETKDASIQSYPYFTCELGGGMMPAYHRRINMSGNEAFPMAVCKLGSGSNLPGYYMYHGGTNPNATPAVGFETMGETQASNVTNYNDMPYMSYDFQAPLGEMGQPLLNAFHQTRWLHQFLADWGNELATMNVDSISEHYARRGYFEFFNNYVRILNEDGIAYVKVINMPFNGHKISINAQPYCKTSDTIYFIPIKGMKPTAIVDNKKYTLKENKPTCIDNVTLVLLSSEKAERAYKIDNKLYYAKNNGGILYKDGNKIVEEFWLKHNITSNDKVINIIKKSEASTPRKIELGKQKVASMPNDNEWNDAAIWEINIDSIVISSQYGNNWDDIFISVTYAGDCARVYADKVLVADNFWNGKDMLVRLSDIIGKHIELRILPMSKDAPIYLQKEQKKELLSHKNYMLELKNVAIIQRKTLY